MNRISFLFAFFAIASVAAFAQDEIPVGEFASLTGGSASFGQPGGEGLVLTNSV